MAVELCVIVAPAAVKDVNEVVAPAAPKEIVPPVPPVNVNALAPLIVLEKVMLAPAAYAPAFVVSKTEAPVNVTGPVQPMFAPFVVMLPPISITVVPV